MIPRRIVSLLAPRDPGPRLGQLLEDNAGMGPGFGTLRLAASLAVVISHAPWLAKGTYDPEVSLAFSSKPGLLSGGGLYVAVEGKARLIRDKAAQGALDTDLEVWFEKGVDTPGLVLIRVQAERIKFWDGNEDGEIQV